jgi:crotonobetainyl-CoA hydratase
MSEPIIVETRGPVMEVTIDRPKANAIDAATSRIMGDVFATFRDDPDLRCAILTAAGEKFFCPGWDLKAAPPARRPIPTTASAASAGCSSFPASASRSSPRSTGSPSAAASRSRCRPT